jgi:hypothetical protein
MRYLYPAFIAFPVIAARLAPQLLFNIHDPFPIDIWINPDRSILRPGLRLEGDSFEIT